MVFILMIWRLGVGIRFRFGEVVGSYMVIPVIKIWLGDGNAFLGLRKCSCVHVFMYVMKLE